MTSLTIDAEARQVATGVREANLPKAEWTHRAHWLAAFVIAIEEDDPAAAMAKAIPLYNEAVGTANTDTEGFHATITFACMAAAQILITDGHAATVAQRVDQLMTGPLGGLAWLERHYSKPLLWSVQARRTIVEPDLRPLSDLRASLAG
ncbi:MAG: hypothetical protein HRU11_12525 [Parvularculaceae bacterium]|nr:hypothetical protein [Parvularculaceae bacterium]